MWSAWLTTSVRWRKADIGDYPNGSTHAFMACDEIPELGAFCDSSNGEAAAGG